MIKAAMAHLPDHPRLNSAGLCNPVRVLGLSVVLMTLLSACGGGGGDDDGGTPPPPGPPTAFNGRISYDKVPFRTTGTGIGLDFNAVIDAPVRGAVVEAINSSDRTTILATTTTDASGNYSMTLPQGASFFVRAKAQLLRAGTPAWNFRVLNNTNGNALYVLDSPNFTNDGTQRNVRATSGWTGTSFTNPRNAAPFSILDVAYEVLTLVQTANPNVVFPALNLHWAPQNQSSDDFVPATGDILTTHFRDAPGQTREVYVLGDQNVDTDEFDQHVIAHELGHYFQSAFSRDDSIGGAHSGADRLDLRVAFSEGWGNAFSGMVKNDPRYRDSFGAQQGQDFDINVESDSIPVMANRGWYNELSAALVIYDLFDATADGVDAVSLGFTPIFQAMGALQNTDVFTSLFSFVPAVKSGQGAGTIAAIDTVVADQNMNAATMNELGSTETNNGGEAANLPIYRTASVNGVVQQVCTSVANGDDHNKLGSRRYLRFEVVGAPRTVTIRAEAVGLDPADPDFHVWRRGLIFEGIDDSSGTGVEQKTTPTLQPGFHVLEVYDFQGVDTDPSTAPACVDVTLS
jgi:hypothetical protein